MYQTAEKTYSYSTEPSRRRTAGSSSSGGGSSRRTVGSQEGGDIRKMRGYIGDYEGSRVEGITQGDFEKLLNGTGVLSTGTTYLVDSCLLVRDGLVIGDIDKEGSIRTCELRRYPTTKKKKKKKEAAASAEEFLRSPQL